MNTNVDIYSNNLKKSEENLFSSKKEVNKNVSTKESPNEYLEDNNYSFRRRLTEVNTNRSNINIIDNESLNGNSDNNSQKSGDKKDFLISNDQSKNVSIINNFQLKIQILANAVKDERGRNFNLENQIKNLKTSMDHYEKLLIEKEDMIVNLSKEKYELQTKYDKEKQLQENLGSQSMFTNFIGNIFNRRDSSVESNSLNDTEYRNLLKENVDLVHENDLLKKRVDDTTEDFNRCKIEYQNIINNQNERIRRMETILQEKNFALDESQKKLQIMYDNHKKYDVEKTKYESSLNELTKDRKLRDEKIIELLQKLEDKENVIMTYKENLQRHEIESAELARKLADLKNAIIESNLVITNYFGQRIGTFFNDDLELIFGRTEENTYVMIIKEKNGEDYVEMEDIEHIKISDKYEDSLDICYVKNMKQVKFTFLTKNYELSKIIQTYKDYLQKAIKSKNNLYY